MNLGDCTCELVNSNKFGNEFKQDPHCVVHGVIREKLSIEDSPVNSVFNDYGPNSDEEEFANKYSQSLNYIHMPTCRSYGSEEVTIDCQCRCPMCGMFLHDGNCPVNSK